MKCPLPKESIKELLRIQDFNIVEIRGGFSKQVYKISTQTESYMLYIWLRPYDGALTENQIDGVEFLFQDGFQHFMYNTELLCNIGVRVPKIITYGHYRDSDFNFAIVECFKGISLDEYMQSGGDISIFDFDKITIEEMKNRVFIGDNKYKTFLIYMSDRLLGFCFLTQFRNKPAYDKTVELGLYLKPQFTGNGLGIEIIRHMEETAKENQFEMLIASISGENIPSIKLFKKLGYGQCAHYREIAGKFGRKVDIIDFQKAII